MQAVDVVGLQTFAVKHRTLVQSLHQPGTFVVEGRPLARLWLEEELTEKAVRNFHANFRLGSRRTPVQDLGFLFDQLTEVALRALSPGINDPITAMRCVDRISQGLRQLGLRQHLCPEAFLPYRRDEEGHLLVVLPELDIEELVANSLGAIRRFSGDNLIVALHLLDTIGILLDVADHTSLQRALRREGRLVRETARPVLLKEDFERLSARYQEVIGDPQS